MTETQKKKGPPRLVIVAAVVAIAAGIAAKFLLQKEFLYAGTLEATKVDLSARLASAIATVEVQEGDHVKVGQNLVQLACEDIRVASALANSNYSRNLKLFQSGTVSQDTMDQIKNRKDDTDVRLSWCSIRSPIQGTILSRYHEPSEWVSPGTKILTVANIQDIWTYIYVPQPEVARLHSGQVVQAFLPELGNREFSGKILKINDEAEFTPKNVQTRAERTRLVFGVKVSFSGANAEEVLKPGMTIEVKLPKE